MRVAHFSFKILQILIAVRETFGTLLVPRRKRQGKRPKVASLLAEFLTWLEVKKKPAGEK